MKRFKDITGLKKDYRKYTLLPFFPLLVRNYAIFQLFFERNDDRLLERRNSRADTCVHYD